MSGPLDKPARSSGGFGGAAAGVHRNNAELAKNAKDNHLGNALCVSLSVTRFENELLTGATGCGKNRNR